MQEEISISTKIVYVLIITTCLSGFHVIRLLSEESRSTFGSGFYIQLAKSNATRETEITYFTAPNLIHLETISSSHVIYSYISPSRKKFRREKASLLE
jgi:hypothetical protein